MSFGSHFRTRRSWYVIMFTHMLTCTLPHTITLIIHTRAHTCTHMGCHSNAESVQKDQIAKQLDEECITLSDRDDQDEKCFYDLTDVDSEFQKGNYYPSVIVKFQPLFLNLCRYFEETSYRWEGDSDCGIFGSC